MARSRPARAHIDTMADSLLMKKSVPFFLAIPALAMCFGLTSQAQSAKKISQQPFGKTADGKQIYVYTLRNASGMEVKILNYGATVASVKVPDKNKKFADVVLGFDSLDGYTSKNNTAYFGAVVGRYGNRIANGAFVLNGHTYHLAKNDPPRPNTLHGGLKGFNQRVWDAKDASGPDGEALELHYLSPDGEEGFPGNLNVTVRFTVEANNGLRIDYGATTDKDTVLNLTNHSYFNLAGAGAKTVLQHRLMIAAQEYTPVNTALIPTGVLAPVAGTPFDFRKLTEIGSRINEDNQQLKFGKGYDHNFVLDTAGSLDKVAVRVEEPTTGRVMEVFTSQPGVQFYTGNFLDGKNHGIGGAYDFRSALCLETQHFPDSPNHPKFPTTELRPGEQFKSTTIYRFSTR